MLLHKLIIQGFQRLQPLAQLLDLSITFPDFTYVTLTYLLGFSARPTTVGTEQGLAERIAHACHMFQEREIQCWTEQGGCKG